GTPITSEILRQIDRAEQFLLDKGFQQVRVRHYGETARIEVADDEMPRLLGNLFRREITEYFRALGYLYTTVDLAGYHSGSLNAVLRPDQIVTRDLVREPAESR